MRVITETKRRELRIFGVSRLEGSLRVAWADESFLVRRARVGVGSCGR
jgi:hypothetical protein